MTLSPRVQEQSSSKSKVRFRVESRSNLDYVLKENRTEDPKFSNIANAQNIINYTSPREQHSIQNIQDWTREKRYSIEMMNNKRIKNNIDSKRFQANSMVANKLSTAQQVSMNSDRMVFFSPTYASSQKPGGFETQV